MATDDEPAMPPDVEKGGSEPLPRAKSQYEHRDLILGVAIGSGVVALAVFIILMR